MAEDAEDRTEAASARRLQNAREEGRVPLSREVPALAGLGAATVMLAALGPGAGTTLLVRLRPMLEDAGRFDSSLLPGALRATAIAIVLVAAPLVLAALAAGVAAGLLQTGLLLRPQALQPDLGRISPRRGLSRIIGKDGLVEVGKSLVKLGVFGTLAWREVAAALPSLPGAALWTPATLAARTGHAVLHLLMTMLAAQAAIAGFDVLWVRHRHARSLRMTRQELRDEHKDTDGNPQVKAKLRQLRRARARRRMMAAVPTATVVVTNPTHYAIALRYDRGAQGAPRVVAKGVDEVAARIREAATEARIPLVANPPLARALYRVELDAEIPADHFKAVAEIIAYVWRLRGRARVG